MRSRVTQLEGAVEAMQNAFFEIHSSALGFAKELESPAQQEAYSAMLRSGTERFVAVAKGVIRTDAGDSLGEEDTGDDQPDNSERPRSRDDGGSASGGANNTPMPLWSGCQVTYGRDAQQEAYDAQQGGSTSSSSRVAYDTPPQDPMDSPFYQNFNFFPTIRHELDPVSYSFQESSFSRRLHRACLENAHQFLSSPEVYHNEISKIFAYTCSYASYQEILATITRMLRSGASDPLNPSAYTQAGPFTVSEAHNKSLRASMDHKQTSKLGILDKFLKPEEVEQRLVEKGLQSEIDGSNTSDRARSPASSHGQGYHSPSNGSMDAAANCFDVDMDTDFPTAPGVAEEAVHMQPCIEGVKQQVDMNVFIKG